MENKPNPYKMKPEELIVFSDKLSFSKMSQDKLLVLEGIYEKAKSKIIEIRDEAQLEFLKLEEERLKYSNDKQDKEVELLETVDKDVRKKIKSDMLTLKTQINRKKITKIHYKKIMETADSKIGKLETLRLSAKRWYFHNQR